MSSSCPCISYADLIAPIYSKLAHDRIPLSAEAELTRRCNLNCKICYCNESANNPQAIKKELKKNDYIYLLNQLAKNGCLWLLFTGGEPFIRKDFFTIYEHAKRKGFLITLFTNGTLITKDIAKRLSTLPPVKVEITLYGMSADTYESITRVKGSFTRCMDAIDYLLSFGIKPDLKTMLNRANVHELSAMKIFANKIKSDFRYDPLIHPRLDGNRKPCKLRLSPRQIARFDYNDKKRRNDWHELIAQNTPQTRMLFTCGAGINSFFLSAYGKIHLCSAYQSLAWSIKNNDFQRIWGKYIPMALKEKIPQDAHCARCDDYEYCQLCFGWSCLENTGGLKKPKFLCAIAKERKNLFKKGGGHE